MTFWKFWQKIIALYVMILCSSSFSVAEVVRTNLSTIELTSDKLSALAGSDFTVVIELSPDQGWHAYWENPGDAGLKLEMDWQLPEGVEIGPLQFRTPHLIPFEEIISYGYDGAVTIIADGKISQDIATSEISIGGNAFWLICSDALCVPQDTAITHKIFIGEDIQNDRAALLAENARSDMPIAASWQSSFYTDGKNFTVKSLIPAEYPVIESAYLYPHSEGMMENVYRQNLSFINGEIIGRFENAYGYMDNDTFDYVLTFKTAEGEEKAFALSAQKSAVAVAEEMVPITTDLAISNLSLPMALIFAFIGGLILNLMPCVFPILSLKAMSVVELSNKHPKEARLSGILYTAGVLVSFALIGAIVSTLSLGWGFHMQMPVINFMLGLLMVTIGLNLLGVFEFGSGFAGLGQGLISASKDNNRKATFFTGVLAVVVATPCTAPFMAGALGFAFVAGGASGMLVFLSLGFGLAFPYLLLCYVPLLRGFLPRPGAWMETMRNILGFPMLATALWLFWILGNQIGVNAMTLSIAASLLLGLALWGLSKNSGLWKALSMLCFVGVLSSGYYLSTLNVQKAVLAQDESGLNSIEFKSAELKNLLNDDQAVFVYFTADWCVTCKLNEKMALSQSEVHQAFAEKDITVMVGDWTNQNPDITKTLQSYGRIGVPLYLYFPEGRALNNPIVLPQILTPGMVIDAL